MRVIGAMLVAVGCGWALIQAALTAVIADIGESAALDCTSGQPKAGLLWTTVGVIVLAAGSGYLAATGRWRLVLASTAIEAALIATWILLGGFSAFDCALDV